MKTKIPTARLELVADKNGDIVWEPRRVPLIKESLGITQRAELARQAMAAPINHAPRLPPPALADFDDLRPTSLWQAFGIFGLALCAWVILGGLALLVWSWL